MRQKAGGELNRQRYLNRAQKLDVIMIAAFMTWLETKTDEWEDIPSISMEQKKYTKMAKAFTNKVLDEIMTGLDPLEVIKVMIDSQKVEVVTRYHDQAIREYREMDKLDSMIHIDRENFLDIVSHAMNLCVVCERSGEIADKCPLKKLWIENDIEPFDLNAPVGKCPYQYKEGLAYATKNEIAN
jgi:hypothetical protein